MRVSGRRVCVLSMGALLAACGGTATHSSPKATRGLAAACYGTFRLASFTNPSLLRTRAAAEGVPSDLTFTQAGEFTAGVGVEGLLGRVHRVSGSRVTFTGVTTDLGASNKHNYPLRYDAERTADWVLGTGSSAVHCTAKGVQIVRGDESMQFVRKSA